MLQLHKPRRQRHAGKKPYSQNVKPTTTQMRAAIFALAIATVARAAVPFVPVNFNAGVRGFVVVMASGGL